MTRPPIRPTHLRFVLEVLAGILRAARPADAILQDLFRSHRQMGSKDRAFVSGFVYGVLRDLRRLQAACGAPDSAAELCAAYLVTQGYAGAEIQALTLPLPAAMEQRLVRPAPDLPPAVRVNLPDWLYDALARQHGAADAEALALALNQPAPVDLRVNTLKTTRDAAQAALLDDGIESRPTPLSPLGLRLARRAALQVSRAFREGFVEPQDEGSQLLALLVAPEPGQAVADYCAGGGGKTLALAALMDNRGTLHAMDVSAARLDKLTARARRAGVTIAHHEVLEPRRRDRLDAIRGTLDAVLVDAPCSATGTLRRNPELRLRSVDLPQLRHQQLEILRAASVLVRPGGALVYATCSLLDEENEDVVRRFLLADSRFEVEDAAATMRRHGVGCAGPFLKLLPHEHGTDGFFGARLRRRE